jgi:uncharacterized membrane protein
MKTGTSDHHVHKPHGSPIWHTIKAIIRARITTGLLTILPIVVTLWLVRVIFTWMRDASQGIVYWILRGEWQKWLPSAWGVAFRGYTPDELKASGIQWLIAIVSVLMTITILYIVGVVAANVIGRRMIEAVEALLERLPGVKTIYRACKQILNSFSGGDQQSFQRVGLVPFPNQITRSVSFITSITRDSTTGEDLCTCFIPTTPNPTTGFVFVVRRCDVIEVPWSIEEAFKMIMSGGILLPASITMVVDPSRPPPPGPSVLPPGGPSPPVAAV